MFQDFLHLRRGRAAEFNFKTSFSRLSSAAMLSELGKTLQTRGPALMVSTACASGTSSIGVAYDWIRLGRVRAAYAGGLGYFSQVSFSGFNILRLTGIAGCRPFDRKRDGMMLGDGFALVSLEREDDAVRRGAQILTRIAGYSCANEAYHATSPDPTGESGFNVMWNSLGCSLERLDRLDYINAHGTGTQANDSAELAAVARLLAMRSGEEQVAMSSTKGAHGHCLGGAGSVEFIAMVLAQNRSVVPPNLGLNDPEEHPERLSLLCEPVARPIRVALSNSFAFSGNVASIAIEAVA
jgi:3-oxoacyl-[acyl-carrier-protein] synthase II